MVATTSRRRPIATEARPSHSSSPVSWASPTPAPARVRPIRAALSSRNTALTVVSAVSLRNRAGVVRRPITHGVQTIRTGEHTALSELPLLSDTRELCRKRAEPAG